MASKDSNPLDSAPYPFATILLEPHNRLAAFVLGALEFRQAEPWEDPARVHVGAVTDLDYAYDAGRQLAHRLTFHAFQTWLSIPLAAQKTRWKELP